MNREDFKVGKWLAGFCRSAAGKTFLDIVHNCQELSSSSPHYRASWVSTARASRISSSLPGLPSYWFTSNKQAYEEGPRNVVCDACHEQMPGIVYVQLIQWMELNMKDGKYRSFFNGKI